MFNSKAVKLYASLVFILPVLGTLFFSYPFKNELLIGQVQNLAFTTSVLLWAVRIRNTLLEKHIRNLLLSQCALILFWYILRMSRFTFFLGSVLLNNYFWYLYYAPIIFMAAVGFCSSLLVGKGEAASRCVLIKCLPLFLVGAVLFLLVLTNDFHNLAFVFESPTTNDVYSYNIVYYIVVVYVASLHFLTFIICTKKSVSYVPLKKLWIVPLIYLIFVVYLLLYGQGILNFRSALGYEPVKFPEAYIFFTMLIWECYMQIGLIPVNTGYDDFVKNSSLSIKIENQHGETFLVSKGFVKQSDESLSTVNLVKHTISSDDKIVSWLVDVSDITALYEKLTEVNLELSEENEIISQKLALSRERIAIEKQNMLYDKMYSATAPQMQKIHSVLQDASFSEDEFEHSLAYACVLGAYVKRKSNLILLCENSAKINVEELAFCFKESIEYLNLYGVASSFVSSAAGVADGFVMNEIYDCFETILESVLHDLSAIMLSLLFNDEGLCLNMEMSVAPSSVSIPAFDGDSVFVTKDFCDDTVYLKICEVKNEAG